ncbi:MAG: hypothetical protein ACRD12_17095, partial [Acidimicrobiales bacterium]
AEDTAALAYEHAEQHLRRALTLVDRLPDGPERVRGELAAQEALGFVLLVTRGYSAPEVGHAVARAVELSRAAGDAPRLLVATWRLLSFHILRAEYGSTRRLATALLDHPDGAATAHRALGAVCFSEGDLPAARHHLERSIALIDTSARDPAERAFEVHPASFARDFLALDLWLTGETERAATVMDAAVATARSLGHPFSECFSRLFAATMAVFEDDRAGARAQSGAAMDVAARLGYGLLHAMAAAITGWADRDVDRMKAALAAAGDAGAAQWRHFFLSLLAQVVWERGRPRSALKVLDAALGHVEATGERFYEPELHRLRAGILLGESPDDAEEALRRAVAMARRQSSAMFLRRAEADLARRR